MSYLKIDLDNYFGFGFGVDLDASFLFLKNEAYGIILNNKKISYYYSPKIYLSKDAFQFVLHYSNFIGYHFIGLDAMLTITYSETYQ